MKRLRMENEHYYKLLVQKYSNRTATDDELEVFIKLFNEGKLDTYLAEAMNEDAGITSFDDKSSQIRVKIRPFWPRIIAAASVLLVISAGSYFILRKPLVIKQIAQSHTHDILPGNNQAILTLANGQKIVLTKGLLGKLAKQGNTQISINTAGGSCLYRIR